VLEPPYIDTTTYSGRGVWRGGYAGLNFQNSLSKDSKLNSNLSVLLQDRESNLISLHYEVYEAELTHQIRLFDKHEIVYGASARIFSNSTQGTYAQTTLPAHRTINRVNWFVQDEIEAMEKVHLILGSKFEYNSSTFFEYMPSVRGIWSPDSNNSVWAAVSRAVAPPSLVFEDIRFPVAAIPGSEQAPPTLVEVFGDRSVASEEVLAYEIGYRAQLSSRASVDIAGFYKRYDNVLSQEPGEPFLDNNSANPFLIVPLSFANAYNATTLGGELALKYKPSSTLSVDVGYAYLHAQPYQGLSQEPAVATFIRGSAPEHSVILRGAADLNDYTTASLSTRYVDSLELNSIDAYIEADANIVWKINENLSFGVYGENLLDSAHQEYTGNLFGPPPIELRRAYYGNIKYTF
jgi:iron complex outermembrane receptor protein